MMVEADDATDQVQAASNTLTRRRRRRRQRGDLWPSWPSTVASPPLPVAVGAGLARPRRGVRRSARQRADAGRRSTVSRGTTTCRSASPRASSPPTSTPSRRRGRRMSTSPWRATMTAAASAGLLVRRHTDVADVRDELLREALTIRLTPTEPWAAHRRIAEAADHATRRRRSASPRTGRRPAPGRRAGGHLVGPGRRRCLRRPHSSSTPSSRLQAAVTGRSYVLLVGRGLVPVHRRAWVRCHGAGASVLPALPVPPSHRRGTAGRSQCTCGLRALPALDAMRLRSPLCTRFALTSTKSRHRGRSRTSLSSLTPSFCRRSIARPPSSSSRWERALPPSANAS